jgi:hypothetical protein
MERNEKNILIYYQRNGTEQNGIEAHGPSRSGLRAQKYDPPPLKQTFPTTFVL